MPRPATDPLSANIIRSGDTEWRSFPPQGWFHSRWTAWPLPFAAIGANITELMPGASSVPSGQITGKL